MFTSSSRLGASRDATPAGTRSHPRLAPEGAQVRRPIVRVVVLTSCRFCSACIAATLAAISARFAAFAVSSMIVERVGQGGVGDVRASL